MQAHHRAREPAVRDGVRRLRPDAAAGGRRRHDRRAQFLAAAPCGPDGKPLAARRRPATPPEAECTDAAGISLSDFYYILPELVLTAGALLVLIADVLLPRGSNARARRG